MALDLHDELLRRGVTSTPLNHSEIDNLGERWLATFAASLPPDQRTYRWHSFSFHHQPCLKGSAALAAYLSQWNAPFYVFDEALSFGVLCRAPVYPDFSELRRDMYVVHKNLKWTVAFTHEQPHLGPFFAEKPVAY